MITYFYNEQELLNTPVDTAFVDVGGVLYKRSSHGIEDLNGVFYSRVEDHITPYDFGAIGDGITDDRWPLIDAISAGGKYKIPVKLLGGVFASYEAVYTVSDLDLVGPGTIRFMAYPDMGGLFTNVWAPKDSIDAIFLREQSNIRVRDVVFDGYSLPDPWFGGRYPTVEENWANDITDWNSEQLLVTTSNGPDLQEAISITSTDVNGVHRLYTTFTIETPRRAVFSVYVRGTGNISLTLTGEAFNQESASAHFNLSTGTLVHKGSRIWQAAIRPHIDNWYEIAIVRDVQVAGDAQAVLKILDSAYEDVHSQTSSVEVSSSWLHQGFNTNLVGFARGASNILVENCVAQGVKEGFGGGTGGGGFGDELGVENVRYINCESRDCYRGFRVNGHSGVFSNTSIHRGVRKLVVNDFRAIRCGCAIFAHSIGAPESDFDSSDLNIIDAVFNGVYAENCGHAPWARFSSTLAKQKTGVIVLGGARNLSIRGLRIKNTDNFWHTVDAFGRSGYPALGSDEIGAGLEGRPGAIIWGWGRNCNISDVIVDGTFDTLWMCARAVAFGELATTAPTTSPHSVRQFTISNVRHVAGGALGSIVNGMSGIDKSRISAKLDNINYYARPTEIIGSGIPSDLSSVSLEVVTNTGDLIIGSLAEWKDSVDSICAGKSTILGTTNTEILNITSRGARVGGLSTESGFIRVDLGKGRTITLSNTNPSSSDGVVGCMHINTANGSLWMKTSGGWSAR